MAVWPGPSRRLMLTAGLAALTAPVSAQPAARRTWALFRQGLILVRAAPEPGGDATPDGLFLLDTGAQATVIDLRLAAAARLHLGRPIDLNAADGDVSARRTGGVRLSLTGGPAARVEATVADLSGAARLMGLPLAGVLGMDFLSRFVVRLDYAAGAVSLILPEAAAPPPATATALRLAGGLPFVFAVASRGARTAQGEFQIDTGSNTAVEFWCPFAQQAFPEARGAPGQSVGVGGDPQATFRGRIDALTVAGRRIAGLTVNFADDARPGGAAEGYGGVIGGPAWTGLILTLDFPRAQMWLG